MKIRPADGRDFEIGRLKATVGELTVTTELPEAKIERLEDGRPLTTAEVEIITARRNV